MGKAVGTSHVAGEDGDDVGSGAVDTQHGGVGVLVLHEGCYGTDTDAHGTDEDEGAKVVPAFGDFATGDDGGPKFALKGFGDAGTGFGDGNEGDECSLWCYLHNKWYGFI